MDDCVKIGTVESVSDRKCKVRLSGQKSTMEMRVLKTLYGTYGYWKPAIGDKVVCLLLKNGAGQGFVIGGI